MGPQLDGPALRESIGWTQRRFDSVPVRCRVTITAIGLDALTRGSACNQLDLERRNGGPWLTASLNPVDPEPWGQSQTGSVEIVAQNLRPGGVAQLAHGLGLDLANPLPGHAVDLSDLIERFGLAIGQTKTHRYDA